MYRVLYCKDSLNVEILGMSAQIMKLGWGGFDFGTEKASIFPAPFKFTLALEFSQLYS